MNIGKSIIVKGKVQGVFFRASTKTEANNLGVNGWVRNLPNGDVELQAFGEKSAVEQLVVWCHQGPQFARVDRVESSDLEYRERSGFEITY